MHTSMMMAVNSPPVAHREPAQAPTNYRPYNDTQVQRTRTEDSVVQESSPERTKKDKKWSLGKLFRRKKKEDESATTSGSDEGVSTRSASKKKAKKKKKCISQPGPANFDHIVMRETRRAQSLLKQSNQDFADDGVLSDPSAGFINHRTKFANDSHTSNELPYFRDENESLHLRVSTEVVTRKSRKGRLKARVEALRNSMRGDSSSDEESLKSSNSSSILRFRSDESLMRSRDSSLNKRSRSARNERYIKRLSRDEENLLNKEAELLQQGYTKAEVEMLTRTPTSQSSGYGTCKRDNLSNKFKPEQIYANDINRRPTRSDSISSFPSNQSYPSTINFNAKVNNDQINYSIQYPNKNNNREFKHFNNNINHDSQDEFKNSENIMCVKFPLGNVTNIKREERAPPVPPPRDMQRKVITPLSMYYENSPIVSDRITHNRNIVHGVVNNDFERVMRRSQERTHPTINGLRRPISTSEDHIAMQNNEYLQNIHTHRGEQPRRPASVSAEPNHYALYANAPQWRKKLDQPSIIRPEPIQPLNNYLYYADHSPRSRRPISIQSSQISQENQNLGDSQSSINKNDIVYRKPRNASEFWKNIDNAEKQKNQQNRFALNGRSNSEGPNIQKYKEIVDHNGLLENNRKLTLHNQPRDITDGSKMWKATTEYKRSVTVEPPKTITSPGSKTHVRHKSDTFILNNHDLPSDDERITERRKSTNLDDALNELEAIYNSLGLGDEDLLDRAEKRESMTNNCGVFGNDWNGNDEIQLRSQPTTPLRRIQRRSTLPDKLHDDMAFRRLNSKEKPVCKDSQSQISYMLASPVYVPYTSDDDKHSEHDRTEPDVVYDDVVYRNIKQSNSRLKTMEPQPPFGIPIGPVSPAPQSDYLHATPENKIRSRFIPRKSPDIVSDDLAYRSLRKDNRHSSLFNGEDHNGHLNNNIYDESPSNIKKKRAIRSLSANIFTMIQKEIDDALNMSKLSTLQKTQSNGDVNRRLRETFENRDHSQDHYPRNKVKQRHNTVSLFVNNCHSPTHHFAKDDSCIHNANKYLDKPPSCDKSKSSSPSRSPQTNKKSSKDEFQQVLSKLAQEAMDTSNKLGVALAELDKNKYYINKTSDTTNKLSDSRLIFLNGLTNQDNNDPKVKHINIHTEIYNEIKPEVALPEQKNNLKAKKTEDSLLAISDQLHKVEDKLKHSFEKEIHFEDESIRLTDHLAKENEKKNAQETIVITPDSKVAPDIIPVNMQDDVICVQVDNNISTTKMKEPLLEESFVTQKYNENFKGEIKAFKELKNGISDLIAGISQVNDKFFTASRTKNDSDKVPGKITGISEASERLNEVTEKLQQEIPVNKRTSVNLSIYEDDLEIVKKDTVDSTEYNSSEELATIFNLEDRAKQRAPHNNELKEKSVVRDDLNSPKLVQTVNQQLRRFSVNNTDDNLPSHSNASTTNVVPWRANRQNYSSQRENGGNNSESKSSWHQSPGTMMLALSYTMACSQHLADMEWLTILGLILAIITIIAMLII